MKAEQDRYPAVLSSFITFSLSLSLCLFFFFFKFDQRGARKDRDLICSTLLPAEYTQEMALADAEKIIAETLLMIDANEVGAAFGEVTQNVVSSEVARQLNEALESAGLAQYVTISNGDITLTAIKQPIHQTATLVIPLLLYFHW